MAKYKTVNDQDVQDTEFTDGFKLVGKNNRTYKDWVEAGGVPDPADPPVKPTYAELRLQKYTARSDPLFMEYRYALAIGDSQAVVEAAKKTWLDEVNSIKTEIPKV
jgi:hypothetical protein